MTDATPLTPALVAKLGRWCNRAFQWQPQQRHVALTIDPEPARVVETLRQHGIGVVDLDRVRCLVDERVYEGALHRGRIGRLFLTQIHPSAATWRALTEGRADG